jgi:hypothetical protein
MTFSLGVCRDFWNTPISSALRVFLSTFVFICLGVFIFYDNQGAHFPTWPPDTSDHNDFLILLPAACLENSTLFADLKSSTNLPAGSIELDKLGSQSFPAMFVILAISYIIAFLVSVLRGRNAKGIDFSRQNKRYFRWRWIWFFLRIPPIGIAIFCWYSISAARTYVNDSGWVVLDNGINPELDSYSIGQLLAIFTALWFIVLLLDVHKRRGKEEHQGPHGKV